MRQDMKEGYRTSHSAVLLNSYYSPNIARAMKQKDEMSGTFSTNGRNEKRYK
jgi:hypothetical protein